VNLDRPGYNSRFVQCSTHENAVKSTFFAPRPALHQLFQQAARLTRAAVGIAAAHLQKLLPRQVDPFYQVAALFGCEAIETGRSSGCGAGALVTLGGAD
jgi:hypothetical protein